jgi:hypothetical protein
VFTARYGLYIYFRLTHTQHRTTLPKTRTVVTFGTGCCNVMELCSLPNQQGCFKAIATEQCHTVWWCGGGGKLFVFQILCLTYFLCQFPHNHFRSTRRYGLKFTFALGPKMSATGRVLICVPSFLTASNRSFLVASVM